MVHQCSNRENNFFQCLVMFVVPSFVVVHCCGDDGGVSVRPSDHHLFSSV